MPFDGRIHRRSLAGRRRDLFLGVGGQGAVWSTVRRRRRDGRRPARLVGPRGHRHLTDDDMLVGRVARQDGRPWVDLLAADGSSTPLLEGDAVGGVPAGGAFSRTVAGCSSWWPAPTPDGAPGGRSRRGRHRPGPPGHRGSPARVPAPVDTLLAHVADDAGGACSGRPTARSAPSSWTSPAAGRPPLAGAGPGAESGLPGPADRRGAAVGRRGRDAVRPRRRGGPAAWTVHQQPVRDVAVAPDGTWAVTAGDGAVVVVWDVDPATGRWSQREVLTGHGGDVVTVDSTRRGSAVYTVSLDDTVITWDMTADGGFGARLPGARRPVDRQPPGVRRTGRPARRADTPVGTASVDRVHPPEDTVERRRDVPRPGHGEVVDERVVGDTVRGHAASAPPSRSARTAAWSPSPGGWGPRCSTPRRTS